MIYLMLWRSLKKIRVEQRPGFVSFTFDDAPETYFTRGGKILEKYNFQATYYVSCGVFDKQSDVGKIADRYLVEKAGKQGHEVGNHTYDHLNCGQAKFRDIITSIQRNRRQMPELMGSSFAYPFGSHSRKARLAVRLLGMSGRTINPGINRGVLDVAQIKGNCIYHRLGLDECFRLIDRCAGSGGWLVFYTHDVCREPSPYGCTEEEFEQVVERVHERGVQVLTVADALKTLKAAQGDGG